MAVENPAGRAGAPIAITAQRRVTGAKFPAGAQTRSVSADGRFRFAAGPGGLAELLGWGTGALDAVGIEGWLVLTQRPEQVGAPRGRNRATAGFIVSARCERLTLRAAHLANLGVAPGNHLLIAPVPARGALVVVDPCVCAALAPERVGRLLDFGTPALGLPDVSAPDLDGWTEEPDDWPDEPDDWADEPDVDGAPGMFTGLRLVAPITDTGRERR